MWTLVFNAPIGLGIVALYMIVHHVPACIRLSHSDAGRNVCMPCRGKKNNSWWIRGIIVMAWLLFGTCIFMCCERTNELAINADKEEMLLKWDHVMTKLAALEASGVILRNDSAVLRLGPPIKTTDNWGSQGSWYFSTQVISSIGYGDFTPLTLEGRWL